MWSVVRSTPRTVASPEVTGSKPGAGAQEAGLAGAVGADHDDDLTLVEREIDPGKGGEAAGECDRGTKVDDRGHGLPHHGRGGGYRGSKRGSGRRPGGGLAPVAAGAQLGRLIGPRAAPECRGAQRMWASALIGSSEVGPIAGDLGPGEVPERRLVRHQEVGRLPLRRAQLADPLVEGDVLRRDGPDGGHEVVPGHGQRAGQERRRRWPASRGRARSEMPARSSAGAVASLVRRSRVASTRILAAWSGSSSFVGDAPEEQLAQDLALVGLHPQLGEPVLRR